MKLNWYFLQGILLGLEWDWDMKWLTLNLICLRITFSWPTEEGRLLHLED
jgi:hypothetical protein